MEKKGINGNDNYEHYKVDSPMRLLDWLLANLNRSRSKIKATLAGHGIRVNGKVVTQYDFPLLPGMRVDVSKSQNVKELRNRYVSLVYEDRYIVVVNKKAGILSMPAGHSSLNVKSVLDDYFLQCHQHCKAHVVHRLDRDTSGLMIYAKDKQTELALESDWHNIVYDRRYIAVLSGVLSQDSGTIENWLKDNKAYFTYSSTVDNGGKLAISHFRVIKRNEFYSLVEFRLETGRKNQIRVHAADIGHPVCGDVKYGNGDDPIGRLCLHAYKLCFYHPVTHKPMEFSTDIPGSFRSLF